VLCGGLPQERQVRLSTCHGRRSTVAPAPPYPYLPLPSQAERGASSCARRTFAPSQFIPSLIFDCTRAFDRFVEGASLVSGKDRGVMYRRTCVHPCTHGCGPCRRHLPRSSCHYRLSSPRMSPMHLLSSLRVRHLRPPCQSILVMGPGAAGFGVGFNLAHRTYACICPPSKWREQLRLRLDYWMPGDSCDCQLRYRKGIQFEPSGASARASVYVIWDTRAWAHVGTKCSFCSLYGCKHRSPIKQSLHCTIIRPSRSTNNKPLRK
jgi:hypothetical protein